MDFSADTERTQNDTLPAASDKFLYLLTLSEDLESGLLIANEGQNLAVQGSYGKASVARLPC
jgi:hypothetical protein